MPMLGISELLVILLILLVVFGASRLPQLGESMGRTIRNFKRGMGTDEKIQIGESSLPAQSKPRSKSEPSDDDVDDAEVVDPNK